MCSRGSAGLLGAPLPSLDPGVSFSPPTLLCLRRFTASLRRPCRALGRREEDLLFASMRARLDAASRDGGREVDVREEVGVPVDWRAAKEVVARVRGAGFRPPDEGGAAEGSSARSHMAAVDCDRVIRSRPLLTNVGVFVMGGSMNVFLRLVGVGGVRPMPLLTNVLPELEPEPSRRPAEEAGRRRLMPMPEARDRLRFPFEPVTMPEIST